MTTSSNVPAGFRMSAFTAAIGICRYLRDHPGTAVDEAALALKRSDADFAGADFNGGLELCGCITPDIDLTDIPGLIRHALSTLIVANQPWWIKLIPYGRQRLATALTKDELQTFRAAGLYDPHPSLAAVAWWDHLAAQARAVEDERFSEQGRHAELLSFNREGNRLKAEGIDIPPVWTALDDNGAGYDIKSYIKSAYGLTNLLIEVKSTTRNPPRIILTRGEWEAATKYGTAYVFHVWRFPAEELTVHTVADIAPHIPDDRADGSWQDVEIII